MLGPPIFLWVAPTFCWWNHVAQKLPTTRDIVGSYFARVRCSRSTFLALSVKIDRVRRATLFRYDGCKLMKFAALFDALPDALHMSLTGRGSSTALGTKPMCFWVQFTPWSWVTSLLIPCVSLCSLASTILHSSVTFHKAFAASRGSSSISKITSSRKSASFLSICVTVSCFLLTSFSRALFPGCTLLLR